MKKIFVWTFSLLSLSLCSLSVSALDFTVEKTPQLGLIKNFKASELCIVAENTDRYLENNTEDTFAVHSGVVFAEKIALKKIKQTLTFICKTYREDIKAKRQSRLHDNKFVLENFKFYRWSPDLITAQKIANKSTNAVKSSMLNAIPNDQIFLTKYYTKLLTASAIKTEKYDQALYSLPYDEVGLSLPQAELKKASLTRFKYTRQQVIDGVLTEKKLAKPLVWLTEEALHDVLLQGTGVLNVAGKQRFFNVHRNNGITYDYSIGKREQARYWYFAEVPSIMGYGQTLASKIAVKPQVTFAGNVADLGLGKLIMVSYQHNDQQISRMGILADQGGAFDNNLFQLDLLVDSYQGWQDYHQANKTLPDYAQAWIMLLK
ncbi:MAG: hypothetical protein ACI9LM_005104 [Alteromonadaceae bacterium]